MKRITFLIFFFFGFLSLTLAQNLPDFRTVKLRKKAQFKNAEPIVMKAIDYIFATPINPKNKERRNAGEFLLAWMNGTPDHVFRVEENETNFFNTDADLVLIYMAALTKYQLANINIKEQKLLVLGAMNIALPYLNAQENKKSWPKELWQLNDAQQKGKLESFLY